MRSTEMAPEVIDFLHRGMIKTEEKTVVYAPTDAVVTDFLYRNLKRSEIEREISKLKEKREMCDDVAMSEHLTKKIIRLKESLKRLQSE